MRDPWYRKGELLGGFSRREVSRKVCKIEGSEVFLALLSKDWSLWIVNFSPDKEKVKGPRSQSPTPVFPEKIFHKMHSDQWRVTVPTCNSAYRCGCTRGS